MEASNILMKKNKILYETEPKSQGGVEEKERMDNAFASLWILAVVGNPGAQWAMTIILTIMFGAIAVVVGVIAVGSLTSADPVHHDQEAERCGKQEKSE